MSTLNYRVHSVVESTQSAPVEFEGSTVMATLPSLTVELVWDDLKDGRDHGSLTLRGVGKDMEWMHSTFKQDEEVVVSFAAAKDPKTT